MLDETTEFGSHATARLRDDIIGWLTTVSSEGAPRPVPIWFLWDGDRSMLLYSRPGKQKLRNVATNPKVSLNLDSDGVDADIVICWVSYASRMIHRRTPCRSTSPSTRSGSLHSAGRRRASQRTSRCRCVSS